MTTTDQHRTWILVVGVYVIEEQDSHLCHCTAVVLEVIVHCTACALFQVGSRGGTTCTVLW